MADDVTSMEDKINSQVPSSNIPTGAEGRMPTSLTTAQEAIVDVRLNLPGGSTIAEAAAAVNLNDTTLTRANIQDAVIIYLIRKGLKADARGHYKYGVTIY